MAKPIKRNPHLVVLSREHHHGLLFCWKIRQGIRYQIAPERIIKYVRYFWKLHFEPHFEEEETLIFRPYPLGQLTTRALDEHENMRQQIGQIADNAGYDTLTAIADLADRHIRYEERILFPALEEQLTQAQLEEIGHALDEAPACGADTFDDEFWLKVYKA